jgi:Na+-transporting methylmalonyl-CoA/oxaloacetate decarboxylase gamma subunit
MTILESLLVSAFGLAVVFVVLIALSLFITLQSKFFTALKLGKNEAPQKKAEEAEPAEKKDAGITAGELKLFDVDEKTAAIIMAIVSHESKIPLSELQFKSIKALD